MKKVISIISLSIMLSITLISQIKAQSVISKPVLDKTELPMIKDQVIITATRSELTREQSPNSTSVVTLKENRIRNTQTLDQALNLTEGIFAFRAKGLMDNEARIMMRGFSGQNRTLILLDGQPINDAYTGNILWTNLPINEMDRIEVARGPYSSLYGGNAMGGVVNLITRPIDKRSIEVSTQYGTFNTTSYNTRYADRFFEKLGVSVGYARTQTGGYPVRLITASPTSGITGTVVTGLRPTSTTTGGRTFITGEGGDNWYNQHTLRFKTDLAITQNTHFSTQYIRQTSAYGYDSSESFILTPAGNKIENGAVLFNDNGIIRRFNLSGGSFLQIPGDANSHFIGGSVLHKFNARTFLNISVGLNDQPDVNFRSPSIALATQADGPGVLSWRSSRNLYANTQLNFQPDEWGKRNTFVFGTETRADSAKAKEFLMTNWQVKSSTTAQSYEALGRTFNQAVYIQDQIRISEQINVVAGLRYDYWHTYDGFYNEFRTNEPVTKYNTRSNNSLTGKIAAAWSVGNRFTIRSAIGTAFRNPTVLDMYRSFRFSSGTLYLGNPSLEPERLLSYEVGIRKQLGRNSEFETTYYNNRITNLIYRKTDLEQDPTGNTRINVNAGEGSTNGVEVSFKHQLTNWLQFRTNYTYTNAIITRNDATPASVGKRIPNAPEHTTSGSLLGAWKRFTGSLNARYVGAVFANDTNSDTTKGVFGGYDPFFLIDASFGVEVGGGVVIFSNIDNIFNRKYFQYFLSPQRSANIGIRWRK